MDNFKENFMIYMGSKNRIAKHILPIMLKEMQDKGYTTWVEPFVGGGNMIDKVPDCYKRIGYDLNGHVIQAMIDIRDQPNNLPESFSFDERKHWKLQEPSELYSCTVGRVLLQVSELISWAVMRAVKVLMIPLTVCEVSVMHLSNRQRFKV